MQASAKAQTEKFRASAKSFDSKYPAVKKTATWVNLVFAAIMFPLKFLFGAAAIVTGVVAVVVLASASVGVKADMGFFWQCFMLTAVFSLLYIWIDKTFSK